ncbi:MAG: hypothetical protein HZY74_03645 [Brevundimonas sp.]|nr:MAG: hypothetical protein HZY74_03645 [Brevundimonas sp.]
MRVLAQALPNTSTRPDPVQAARVQREANLLAWHHSYRAHGLALDRAAAARDRPDEQAFWQAVEASLRPQG